MILCPVCEHQQAQGTECEQCGKALVQAKPAAVPVQTLPELEATAIEAAKAARSAPVQPLAELELNRLVTGPDLPPAPLAELERAHAPVGEVRAEAMPDLDLGRVQDAEPRTARPTGALTCRYCRNVQATGLFCDRCGMRLPKPAAPSPEQVAAKKKGPTVWARCKKCGAPARAGEKCGDCGQEVPFPDA